MASFYEDASLVVIPSGYKTSKIYAEKPTDGSGDLTFTRASGATRVGPNGLIEKVRTNIALYSEQLNDATWTKDGITISANATTSPDGLVTADKLVAAASAGDKIAYQVLTVTDGIAYTSSAYFKAAEYTYAFFRLGGIANNPYVIYNLSTQAVVATSSLTSSTITSVGNGWYRITVTATQTSTTLAPVVMVIPSTGYTLDASNIPEFTGNATSGGFIWGVQTEIGDIATNYIPTTTAAVSVGPVSNVPRLDYLGSSCPRLLLEPQRTNLALYSEQFDNAGWAKENTTVVANSATSPDGTVNADSLVDDATNSRHILYQSFSGDLSTARTLSVFAKQNTLRYLCLSVTIGSDTNCYSAIFDLLEGTVSATKTNGTATLSASIVNYSNGWYRCIISGTLGTGTLAFFPLVVLSNRAGFTGSLLNNNVPIYSGSGQSLFLYGAQFEAGSYATSYIPTLGASVTRVADTASKTGISSLIGQTEGTLFVEIDLKNAPIDNSYILLRDASVNDYLGLRILAGNLRFETVDNGVLQTAINYTANTPQTAKVAMAYKANDFVMYVNGTQVGTDTSATVPTCDILDLNFNAPTANAFGIAQTLLFKTRLTNAQLAELTTL
jgi:hypothetical protein